MPERRSIVTVTRTTDPLESLLEVRRAILADCRTSNGAVSPRRANEAGSLLYWTGHTPSCTGVPSPFRVAGGNSRIGYFPKGRCAYSYRSRTRSKTDRRHSASCRYSDSPIPTGGVSYQRVRQVFPRKAATDRH